MDEIDITAEHGGAALEKSRKFRTKKSSKKVRIKTVTTKTLMDTK